MVSSSTECSTQNSHVPSNDLLGSASRRLRAVFLKEKQQDVGNVDSDEARRENVLDLEKIQKIWRAVGIVIDKSLVWAGRGVRVESLGTFTLDAKRRAQFFIASEFASRHRLIKYDTYASGCTAGAAINAKLNVATV